MKSIKIRLYPNKEQIQMLNQHFGCARFVYNQALSNKIAAYNENKINLSKFDLINSLPELKKTNEFLTSVKAEILQNSMDGIDSAYKKFFKEKSGFPRFKKKHNGGSFTSKQTFKILENVNKLVFYSNKIKFKCSVRDVNEIKTNRIRSITYSKTTSGQFFASILIDFEHKLSPEVSYEIGIDLGLKEFATMSDGEIIENPRFLRNSAVKLARLQKNLSRKVKGSNNINKARLKVAKQHLKIANQRNDFHNKLSKRLIDENQIIYLESLRVKNMIKNHKLAKSIADAGWSSFVSKLEYKAKWYGRYIVKIGTFEPSSKLCSCCGWKKEDLTLADRTFKCRGCGLEINRDLNAAINIMKIGKNHPELTLEETRSVDCHRTKKGENVDLIC